MLDLNNVSYSDSGPKDFEPIPDGVVVRAFLSLTGDMELPSLGAVLTLSRRRVMQSGCLLR